MSLARYATGLCFTGPLAMTDAQLAHLAALTTSAVSDALDRLGIAGQCAGNGTVGDYIDDLAPGQVVVLDNHSRLDATVWGDLLTTTASGRGVAGTVIDGVCRDVDRSLELGYPLFSRGNWMRTGKDRVRVEQTGEPRSRWPRTRSGRA